MKKGDDVAGGAHSGRAEGEEFSCLVRRSDRDVQTDGTIQFSDGCDQDHRLL